MHPDAASLWQGKRWTLAVLLAALATVGPFSIDTFLPAFAGIAAELHASPLQIQQTLSGYLFGFAFMSLFHGALSDSFGRRPVVIVGLVVFTVASAGCALAPSIGALVFFRALQGLSAGAGIVVSRAVVRDMFPPDEAQRVMAQITLFFGVAPAIAPIVGGFLFVHLGWQAVFWFLTLVGGLLLAANWFLLPESLHPTQRQPVHLGHLLRGYVQLGTDRRFLLLALASGVPFNGMFLYVLSAPAFLGELLHLEPTQFFWLFLLTIGGIMGGAWTSGRLAGRIPLARQIHIGMGVMLVVSLLNLGANALWTAQAWWALPPIGLYSFGWALVTPAVTLMVLDLFPQRRGMAASLQAFIGALANGFVAGAISPLVMHSAWLLALGSLAMMCVGLVAWTVAQRWDNRAREAG
ncbi:MAG: Bcr/CflA family efflux MFS transporter [Aquabacterium sp.]|nr:MAG: Bcr/CflA family efflux MFS transporter [Aquabacterium sp.]